MHLIKRDHAGNGTTPQALFDASHGQPYWAQTDFPRDDRTHLVLTIHKVIEVIDGGVFFARITPSCHS